MLAPTAAALAIFAAAIAILMLVALANLWPGLLGTIAAVVLLPSPFSVQIAGATLTPGRFLLFALLVGWFIQRRRADRREAARPTPIEPFLWFIVAALILSVIANLPELSTAELASAARKIALFGVDFFLLFGVTVAALRVKQRALLLLQFMTGLIAFTAVLGLVERITGRNVFEYLSPVLPSSVNTFVSRLAEGSVLGRGTISRVHGTFEQPLIFALVLLLGLPLAAAFAMGATTTVSRLAWSGTTLCIGIALLFTASRGAYVVAAVTLVTLIVLAPDRRARRGLLGATLLLIAFGLVQTDVRETMSSYLFNVERGGRLEGSLQSRVDAFDATTQLLEDRPFLGFGVGIFSLGELTQERSSTPVNPQVLDNGYLGFAAETGAIGLVTLVGFLFAAWLTAERFWQQSVDRNDRLVGAALLAAIQSWILFAFFADEYAFNAPPRLFFVLLGALAVLRRETLTSEPEPALFAAL